MRREDKEIKDQKEIQAIIEKATVCRVAFSESDVPYIVPVNFGHEGDCLYFHSAPEGKKIEIIKKNDRVCFEMDVDQEVVKSGTPCDWEMKYRSVIGFGTALLVNDLEERRRALNAIVGHYSGDPYEYPANALREVAVVKIEIESMTGKKSGY